MPDLNTVANRKNHQAIALWLLICCATIYSMIIPGGVTRLTGSCLSMVEWAPIMGVLPPLNDQQGNMPFRFISSSPSSS